MNVTLRKIAPGSLVVGLVWLSLSAPISCANSTPQPPPHKDAGHHHTDQDATSPETGGGGNCGGIGQKCCAPPNLCDIGAFCSMTDGTCKDQHPPDIGQPCSSSSTCSSGICGYTQGISDGATTVPDGNGTPPPQPTGCTVGCFSTMECTPGWTCQQIVVGEGTCVCTWAPEICNGMDDNCDGLIDNEPEVDNYCTAMMEGIPAKCVEGALDGGGAAGGAHCACVDMCAETCVNLKTDDMNCGKCGNACKPLVEKCQEGSCGCAFTTCPSGCVNTGGNDPMNCGDCGKVCPYMCAMGNCTPVTLASGFYSVGSIAVDSKNVYWLAEGTTFTTEVDYCPTSGCGTAPGTLATSTTGGSVEATDGLAVTATNIYFADNVSSVEVSPIPASFPPTPPIPKATVFSAKNAAYGTYVASDSVNLYWADGSAETIYSCALGTSCLTPTLVANTSTAGSPTGGLAVSGSNVYFATYSAVFGTPVSGSGPITKICTYTGFSSATSMLVAGGNVYFTDGFSAVYSCSLTVTGTAPAAAMYYADTSPAALATDGVNLYWSTSSFPTGDIKKCALGTTCAAIPGPTTVISGISPPGSMAVGATDLFWTTYDTTTMGTIKRYSK